MASDDDEAILLKGVPLDLNSEVGRKYIKGQIKKSALRIGVVGIILFLPGFVWFLNVCSGGMAAIKSLLFFVILFYVWSLLSGALLAAAAGLYFLKNWARMLLIVTSWIFLTVIGLVFLVFSVGAFFTRGAIWMKIVFMVPVTGLIVALESCIVCFLRWLASGEVRDACINAGGGV